MVLLKEAEAKRASEWEAPGRGRPESPRGQSPLNDRAILYQQRRKAPAFRHRDIRRRPKAPHYSF